MSLFSNLDNTKSPALFDHGCSYSYKELNEDMKKFDNFFESRSSILFFGKNNYSSIIFYIYCIRNKLIPILIDPEINNQYVKKIINSYKPDYIYAPKIKNLNYVDYVFQGNFLNYYLFKNKKKIEYEKFNKLAILLSTSGSTGSPKFVRLSYNNIFSNCISIIKYLNITKEHRSITSLPFNYSYGLSIINTHIHIGGSLILTNESMAQKKFWEQFQDLSCTSFAGVPFHYNILKNLKFNKFNLDNFKYSTIAGGALDENTLNYFIKFYKSKNKKLIIMYGQTEASPRISYVPWEKIEDKKNSIGIPIPNGNISLIYSKQNDKTNNLEGELVYRGPNVSLGYAEGFKDLSFGDENQGCLNTGDIAYQDEDGYFYIVGRKKRFAKIYGNRINLDEIERNLKLDNLNAACIEKNNKINIYIIDKAYKKDVIAIINKKMNLSLKFINLIEIKEFPLKNNGKFDYEKLLNL
jgi:acyl-CoA synthetase (AMP-forming)/AMP-acid ligase II|tara:strand:+ start:598 stop:1995 length:1398 start_codon:yes stop_codon:yes gene_type:complete